MTEPDYKALCAELVVIEDAMSGGSVQLSNQGQALDGYSALASFRCVADKARTLLAQPEPQPVLVSERLPVPADCDEQGWVWAWRVYDAQDDDSGDYWMQIPYGWLPHYLRWSHWLPASALPTPSPSN
jgi:hypothetical protein